MRHLLQDFASHLHPPTPISLLCSVSSGLGSPELIRREDEPNRHGSVGGLEQRVQTARRGILSVPWLVRAVLFSLLKERQNTYFCFSKVTKSINHL